jgi:L-ascorbate metabolism protein UlaG (beta-lactamase superfamily)
MTIHKFGHCCLLIEIDGIKILTDPGNFTTAQNDATGVDVIVITHEHGDHLHVESVKEILKKNPGATIVTNSGVGKQLDAIGVPYTVIEGRNTTNIKGVAFEAFDCKHEEIFEDFGQVQNTAYLIGGKLLLPGDAYLDPQKPVEVLALPIAGPWLRLPDALHYAIRVKPKFAFPIHDGIIRTDIGNFALTLGEKILKPRGIEFRPMAAGSEETF